MFADILILINPDIAFFAGEIVKYFTHDDDEDKLNPVFDFDKWGYAWIKNARDSTNGGKKYLKQCKISQSAKISVPMFIVYTLCGLFFNRWK